MTYEYTCKTCGHNFEAEQGIKDPPLELCTKCGDQSAKRLISGGTGFALHGEGWASSSYQKSSLPKA